MVRLLLCQFFTFSAAFISQGNLVQAVEPACLSFCGPTGMGIAESAEVTTAVDAKSNLALRTPLKGVGWSSPVSASQSMPVEKPAAL